MFMYVRGSCILLMRAMNFFPKRARRRRRRSNIFRITLKMKVRSSKADLAADKSPRGVDLAVEEGGGNSRRGRGRASRVKSA